MMFLWLTLSVLSFGIGEYLSKRWSLAPSWKLAVSLVIPYILGVLLWLPALRAGKSLAITGTTWTIMSTAVTVGIGVIGFHEHLTGLNWWGVWLAVISMILLQLR